jgi:hypothetical protein
LGDNWIQRFIYVGTSFTRNPTVKFYSKSGCPLLQSFSQTSRIVMLNFYPTWNSGTGPTLSNVIRLQSQTYCARTQTKGQTYARRSGPLLAGWLALPSLG